MAIPDLFTAHNKLFWMWPRVVLMVSFSFTILLGLFVRSESPKMPDPPGFILMLLFLPAKAGSLIGCGLLGVILCVELAIFYLPTLPPPLVTLIGFVFGAWTSAIVLQLLHNLVRSYFGKPKKPIRFTKTDPFRGRHSQ